MRWIWREYMRNWKTKLFFSIGVVIIFAALSAATVKFFLDSAVAPVKAPGNAKQNTTPVPLENGSTLPATTPAAPSPSAHHHHTAPAHTYTPAPTRTYTFRPTPKPTPTRTPTPTPTPTVTPTPTATSTDTVTPTPTGTSTDATPPVPAVPGSTPGF